ncbi:MAG TPA: hypothetical protein ENK13_02065, partial [Thermopetrobacter sp.]|nr:hypothetical protein [Thermopetrobacter sp.]
MRPCHSSRGGVKRALTITDAASSRRHAFCPRPKADMVVVNTGTAAIARRTEPHDLTHEIKTAAQGGVANGKHAHGTPRDAVAARLKRAGRLLALRESGRPVYGALDLGTNNCRLLLAMPDGEGGFEVVDAFSRIVRLGEGLGRTGRLSEAAQRRTIDALRICANKMRWWRVKKARLIATQACRLADNGPEFAARVKAGLGLDLEIIDQAEEARLAAAGVCQLLQNEPGEVLVFDIGGGSTELLWLHATCAGFDYEVHDWLSVSHGVITIAEQFGGDVIDAATYERMRAAVRARLTAFRDKL